MKKFDFSRYCLVLRKQFAEDWRRQFGFTLVMTMLLFFMFWMFNWMAGIEHYQELSGHDDLLYSISFAKITTFLSIVALAIGYQSAHSMPFMKSKGAQVAHTVLPATTLEKYAVVQTFAFLCSVVEAIVAFFIADGIQYFMCGHFTIADLAGFNPDSAFDMSVVTPMMGTMNVVLWDLVVVILLHSAWFTFCATTFRKHPFLIGILILWGASQLLSVAVFSVSGEMNGLLRIIASSTEGMSTAEFMGSLNNIFYVTIAIQLVLAIVFWIWSYFRMKRVEL